MYSITISKLKSILVKFDSEHKEFSSYISKQDEEVVIFDVDDDQYIIPRHIYHDCIISIRYIKEVVKVEGKTLSF